MDYVDENLIQNTIEERSTINLATSKQVNLLFYIGIQCLIDWRT